MIQLYAGNLLPGMEILPLRSCPLYLVPKLLVAVLKKSVVCNVVVQILVAETVVVKIDRMRTSYKSLVESCRVC